MAFQNLYVDFNEMGKDTSTGELNRVGCDVRYNGQEVSVSFLTIDDLSRPLKDAELRSKLRQLGEALLEAAQSPECVGGRLVE